MKKNIARMPVSGHPVVAALLVVAAAINLFAQSNLNQGISGQVTDPSGAAVAQANVTVVEQGTGLTRNTVTNESGNYIVPNLPTGKYRVTAEASGFKKEVIGDNPLNTDVSIEVNLRLEVGSQADAITVHADVETVESASGELGYTVTGQQAGELQLNGRNFSELLELLPGVSTTYTDGFSLFTAGDTNDSGQSINGGRTNVLTVNLDGADNQDSGSGGNPFIGINPNAIGEFRVLSSNYSAEYGTSSGGVVNIAIRSGTKDFHGMLYEYWRNDELQASTFNAATAGKPELRWNNFGGNIGGPVLLPKIGFNKDRNQLFFFFSQDTKVLRQGTTTTWTVPTAALKSGNFGSSTVRDPVTQVPYPNNMLPASVIDPNMQKMVDIYPNANSGTASYIFNSVTPITLPEEIVKLDYNHDEKNQVSFHWAYDHATELQNTNMLIEFWKYVPGVNTALEWNHVFSPTLINVAMISDSYDSFNSQSDVVPNTRFIPSITRQGNGLTLPTIYNASQDIPQVAIAGYTTLTVSPLNFENIGRVVDLKDNLTKVAGNHTLKTGILVMRNSKDQDSPPAINGQFTFNTTRSPTSGQAMADTLLGDFYQYQEYGADRYGFFRFWQVEPFFQDDWKATSRLTLNLGLRWAYMQPQYSSLNNTSQFLPQYFNPAQAAVINPSNGQVTSAPNPYNGLVLDGPGFPAAANGRVQVYGNPAVEALFHNLPLAGVKTQWGDYSPRFGFAYDLTGKQSTVLRGGFGVSYERINGNYIIPAINNSPFNPVATILNGNVENPGNGAAGPNSVQAISASHYLDMKNPRTLTWSLGVQQKVDSTSVLSVSYVGSSASNLSFIDDPNQPALGYCNSVFVPGTTTLANANACRPYAGYGNIQEYDTGGNFIYNSLQMQYRKQLRNGGIVTSAFTYASNRTDTPNVGYQPENSYNLRGDWGPSSYGRREVWTSSYVYPLPWWRGGGAWYKQAFGGWQFNGIGLMQSGLPVNITVSNTTAPGTAGDAGSGVRPNLIGNPYSGGAVGGYQVLNPAAFQSPATNTFGNLGAYAVFLPRWINLNSSLSKSFWVHEHYKFDIKFDMYNVANHLSISGVSTGGFNGVTLKNGIFVSSVANWGAESATTPPRTMEMSLRLSF